ncbi:MAG TPA: hypothetical protein VFI08_09790 [Spirochaetia bacterium]|nr:hypothetical protein [Spirochaetia bacterium]
MRRALVLCGMFLALTTGLTGAQWKATPRSGNGTFDVVLDPAD